jgi:hypothetical protein
MQSRITSCEYKNLKAFVRTSRYQPSGNAGRVQTIRGYYLGRMNGCLEPEIVLNYEPEKVDKGCLTFNMVGHAEADALRNIIREAVGAGSNLAAFSMVENLSGSDVAVSRSDSGIKTKHERKSGPGGPNRRSPVCRDRLDRLQRQS